MKKFISALLVVLFVISLGLECLAYNNNRIETEYFEESCAEYSGQEVFSAQMPSYFYNRSNGGIACSSYSLLNDLEKVYYDRIVSLDIGVLSFTVKYSPALPKAQFETIDFTKIMYAICLDHPEIFYYSGYGYSKSVYSNGSVISVTYNILPKKHGQTNAAIYSASNIPGYYKAMMDVINSANFNTSTRYDFIKSVHDYLCNNVTYINDYASCHDAYGTLVNGEAVCQGYAETFKLFCDMYKIPCVCITGTAGGAHMWNAVQMDDGLWYLIDATWDDQDSYGIYTDFFLIGLQTKDTYFTGEPFNVSHISDGSPYLPSLNYAQTAFDSTKKISSFGATFNSNELSAKKKIVLSFFDAEENNVYYNGIYIPIDRYFTSATFQVPSGKNSVKENWKLILIGDCIGDGYADNKDYDVAVIRALNDPDVSDDYDLACDANSDGVIAALDIAILERAIGGSNENIIIEN